MASSRDFGAYLHNFGWPPLQADGISGNDACSAACELTRAFAAGEDRDASPNPRRSENDRLSHQVRAGLLLLLASCGWIVGGDDGVRLALTRGSSLSPRPPHGPVSEQSSLRRLCRSDAPELFAEIDAICWRGKLRRPPQICVLIGQRAMNAYASGGQDDATITFTEGLLRGMTTKEISAIFAHEVAHICNGDGLTMSWAAGLQRAIHDVVASGLASGQIYGTNRSQASLHWLLERAPAIAELLLLALSRFRELEADALALELTGDAKTLESALAKLERHHRALTGVPQSYVEDRLASYLRSHPVTSDRIGQLRASALYGAA